MPTQHVAVIGGGFVGSACALHLLRRGHRVTLIEAAVRGGTRTAASYGNAGTFANYAVRPVNDPWLPTRLPSLLGSSTSPLALVR